MNKRTFVNLLLSVLLLSLLVGTGTWADSHANAQELEPPRAGGTRPLSPAGGGPGNVTSQFTYQGLLKSGGEPVNANCDFLFSLWNESGAGAPPTGGLQVGATQTVTVVSVTEGLFTVVLDFGSDAFDGQRRYLQIAVRCPAGGGTYTPLDSRQLLWATPYALSLRPGAMISGTVNSGATVYGGAALSASNVSTDTNTAGLAGVSASTAGAGVLGHATSTSGYAYGVIGDSLSTSGRGVYGRATATSGSTVGVKGVSDSTGGAGVQGQATAITGTTYGVYGESKSPIGIGGYFESDGAGVYASGGDNAPDLVLGGTSSNDDGRIESDPKYASSDIILISHDEVHVRLDVDGNEDGHFIVIGGEDTHLLTVDEAGDVSQPDTSNGLVKAGVVGRCGKSLSSITRSFKNASGGAISIANGASNGYCGINFGFDLSNRYWSITAFPISPPMDTHALVTGCFIDNSNNNLLWCYRYNPAAGFEDGGVVVLIY